MHRDEALEVLGVERAGGRDAARRAYLKLVRKHRPERDPEGFQRIRGAWEALDDAPAWFWAMPDDDVSDPGSDAGPVVRRVELEELLTHLESSATIDELDAAIDEVEAEPSTPEGPEDDPADVLPPRPTPDAGPDPLASLYADGLDLDGRRDNTAAIEAFEAAHAALVADVPGASAQLAAALEALVAAPWPRLADEEHVAQAVLRAMNPRTSSLRERQAVVQAFGAYVRSAYATRRHLPTRWLHLDHHLGPFADVSSTTIHPEVLAALLGWLWDDDHDALLDRLDAFRRAHHHAARAAARWTEREAVVFHVPVAGALGHAPPDPVAQEPDTLVTLTLRVFGMGFLFAIAAAGLSTSPALFALPVLVLGWIFLVNGVLWVEAIWAELAPRLGLSVQQDEDFRVPFLRFPMAVFAAVVIARVVLVAGDETSGFVTFLVGAFGLGAGLMGIVAGLRAYRLALARWGRFAAATIVFWLFVIPAFAGSRMLVGGGEGGADAAVSVPPPTFGVGIDAQRALDDICTNPAFDDGACAHAHEVWRLVEDGLCDAARPRLEDMVLVPHDLVRTGGQDGVDAVERLKRAVMARCIPLPASLREPTQ